MGSCLSRNGMMFKKSFSFMSCGMPWKKELSNELIEALAAEAKNDEQLAMLPGRMCCNGASNVASLFTQQGRKGTNQDAMLVWEDFASVEGTIFCGVFDGHGRYGHLVARRVRDSLPTKLFSLWQTGRSKTEQETKAHVHNISDESDTVSELYDQNVSNYLTEENIDADSEGCSFNDSMDCSCLSQESDVFLWNDAHIKAFRAMDKDLKRHPKIDCFCSGTTVVTILKQGEDLIVANVGDSRAVLATRADDNSLVPVQLTVDLKPNLPREKERVRQCKGRVFCLEDEPDVYRVWTPYDDSPGLAMTRSLGDFCLKEYGVICIPEITCRHLTENDLFIILATDGVWDVLSNQEAISIVAAAPNRLSAASCLVESAVRTWKLKFPNATLDDCAAVCLYLHSDDSSTGDRSD
eukprot:c27597_g1_i1 orf=336-1562(-)